MLLFIVLHNFRILCTDCIEIETINRYLYYYPVVHNYTTFLSSHNLPVQPLAVYVTGGCSVHKSMALRL